MSRLIIDIKDESKKGIIIDLLNEIPFVSFEFEKEPSKKDFTAGLHALCGLWKDREISLSDIRKKAWNR